MIRYKEFILSLLCLGLLLTSCGQDEVPVGTKGSGPLTFKLHLSGNGNPATRAVDAPYYEDVNSPVYLYVYETSAGNEALPFIFMKDSIKNSGEMTFTYWPENDEMRSKRYDIYAIGYDGNSGVTLDSLTKADLLDLQQSGTDINSPDKMYMLSGGLKNTDFYHADKTITLTRNVCRLSLNITDNTPGQALTKITVTLQSYNKTYAFDSAMRGNTDIPFGAGMMDYTTKEIVHNNHVFNDSIYFFEKKPTVAEMQESDKVLVKIAAVNSANATLNYKFLLNKDEGGITSRNTIYRVTASLTATEMIILRENQIPWEDGGIVGITPVVPAP